jgi:uncharacterized protein (DUF302 family)
MTTRSIDGLRTTTSTLGPKATMDKLEAAVRARGIQVFARIDHAAGAASVGMALRPTELLIFGAPAGGTPLMQAYQTLGIDLPLKALVWQDEAGVTFLSYNDLAWLVRRHGSDSDIGAPIAKLEGLLAALVRAATEAA